MFSLFVLILILLENESEIHPPARRKRDFPAEHHRDRALGVPAYVRGAIFGGAGALQPPAAGSRQVLSRFRYIVEINYC